MKYLFQNVNEIPKLQALYMDYNIINDTGGKILLNTLHKCRELKILKIKSNIISNYDDLIRKIKDKHSNKKLDIQ